jgi:hypothetical protein
MRLHADIGKQNVDREKQAFELPCSGPVLFDRKDAACGAIKNACKRRAGAGNYVPFDTVFTSNACNDSGATQPIVNECASNRVR